MNVLVYVADPRLRGDLVGAAQRAGHEAWDCAGEDEILLRLGEQHVDAVLFDLGFGDGLGRARRLRAGAADVGLVAIGNDLDPAQLVEARAAGVDAFLRRPFDIESLERCLSEVGRHGGRRWADSTLIAEDPRSRALLDVLERAALSDATLLLSGPSGSGRTRLARFVHGLSRRSGRTLIEVGCGELGESEAEKVLFGGYGAGASAGRIEAAHGGTLLLEDVQELSLPLQGRLLHALQERRVVPLGGRRGVSVDARVVATARGDLAEHVAAGRFREDLRLRLGVIELAIPALKDRPGDVPALAQLFLQRDAESAGRPPARLEPEALAALGRRDFPGNLHELESLMRRANLLYRGKLLGVEALEAPQAVVRSVAPLPASGLDLRRLEREAVVRSLQAARGNRTLAARALGISTRTLRNKIRRYELA